MEKLILMFQRFLLTDCLPNNIGFRLGESDFVVSTADFLADLFATGNLNFWLNDSIRWRIEIMSRSNSWTVLNSIIIFTVLVLCAKLLNWVSYAWCSECFCVKFKIYCKSTLGKNSVAESVGACDSRILRKAIEWLLYLVVFCPMYPQSCNI